VVDVDLWVELGGCGFEGWVRLDRVVLFHTNLIWHLEFFIYFCFCVLFLFVCFVANILATSRKKSENSPFLTLCVSILRLPAVL